MTRILLVVALVLFVLAALVGGGAVDPDPAVLRFQVLTALGFVAWVGSELT